ncbi:hypothetical protein OEA41_000169 [Lepraria neglecta]|uniref:Fungal N-terminal domain-containing protein n=1 Tax=Lepraria neglecta TaxID=209136 RepID=A0AAD9ZI56_9LECA|nr:hypothetical protein OEA41_000169 [Lepraria neglecta]
MDPISASTTALSVIGARTAPAHIQRLATEMQGLYNLLATIQRLLEKNHTQNDQIITDMLENLETILHDCIEVFKDRGFLWATFKKDDVMALQQTLGSYRAMLNMSFSALSVIYASHTDDVVVKIDKNTSQIKGNLENMQSDASRIDTRLKVLQKAVKRLERHLDDQEREELLGEGEAQGDQAVDPIDSPSANNRPESNRTSVASYNSSLRRSLRDLGSIISSSSAMSRMPSMLISAVPESAEQHPSQKGGLVMAQEEGGNGALEDDEKYRAFIETVASLKLDEDPDSELSTTPTFQENSPDLGDLDDNHTGHRIGFDTTSEGHDWDSEAANPSAISPCGALEALQLLPRPPDYLQNPRPPPLPPGLHRRQVSESAI